MPASSPRRGGGGQRAFKGAAGVWMGWEAAVEAAVEACEARVVRGWPRIEKAPQLQIPNFFKSVVFTFKLGTVVITRRGHAGSQGIGAWGRVSGSGWRPDPDLLRARARAGGEHSLPTEERKSKGRKPSLETATPTPSPESFGREDEWAPCLREAPEPSPPVRREVAGEVIGSGLGELQPQMLWAKTFSLRAKVSSWPQGVLLGPPRNSPTLFLEPRLQP